MKEKKNTKFAASDFTKGKKAYHTLVDLVRSAPEIIKELEKSGNKKKLNQYKLEIKLVLEKLKEIKEVLDKD